MFSYDNRELQDLTVPEINYLMQDLIEQRTKLLKEEELKSKGDFLDLHWLQNQEVFFKINPYGIERGGLANEYAVWGSWPKQYKVHGNRFNLTTPGLFLRKASPFEIPTFEIYSYNPVTMTNFIIDLGLKIKADQAIKDQFNLLFTVLESA